MKKTDKKQSKKKIAILALFIFALVGLAGYGVYSYYWTAGNFSGTGSTISIAAFNPQTTINGEESFLGSGGTLRITCPDSTTGNEHLSCTGSVLVSNDGDTDITVQVLDASTGKYSNSAENFDIEVSDASFNWTTQTISAGDSETLNITVPVTVVSDYGSNSAVDAGDSVKSTTGNLGVDVSLKLKAIQVH